MLLQHSQSSAFQAQDCLTVAFIKVGRQGGGKLGGWLAGRWAVCLVKGKEVAGEQL